MLRDDIELIDKDINNGSVWSHHREAWQRIKAALAEAQKPSPNKPIMPVCQYCKGTGYLSPNGTSVVAGEHCPGWKYCTCRSGKPA